MDRIFRSRAEVIEHFARAADARLKADGVDTSDLDAVRRGLNAVMPTRLWSWEAWCEYHGRAEQPTLLGD